jgi:hypothetical protein
MRLLLTLRIALVDVDDGLAALLAGLAAARTC